MRRLKKKEKPCNAGNKNYPGQLNGQFAIPLQYYTRNKGYYQAQEGRLLPEV
jgi:hypothetical protein